MACRKNAYRALTEVAEWKIKQDEERATILLNIKEKLESKWTFSTSSREGQQQDDGEVEEDKKLPPLCYLWLQDGHERGPTCGCNGGCGKEHPRVVFQYEMNPKIEQANGTGGAIALLSHPLQPFSDYFDRLCQDGMAWKENDTKYRLRGFLQEHMDRLEKIPRAGGSPFGFHLVKVTADALSASRRAHEAFQRAQDEENKRRATKKRTRDAVVQQRSYRGYAESDKSLVEQVLQVMSHNHWFRDNLDLLDLHYWRMSGIPGRSFADQLVRQRMADLYLQCIILKDRKQSNEEVVVTRLPERLSWETGSTLSIYVPLPGGGYRKEDFGGFVSLGLSEYFQQDSSSSCWKRDIDMNGKPFITQVQIPRCQSTDLEVESSHEARSSDEKTPGEGYELLVRLFTRINQDKRKVSPALRQIKSLENQAWARKEVVRCRIQCNKGGPKISKKDGERNNDPRIEYSIRDFNEDASTLILHSVKLTFEDLMGVYVRQMLHSSRQKLRTIQRERPATQAEKDVVRRYARAAREHVPGHARDFEGFMGWNN